MISIGSVIGGGFRLFREQPVALLIWWGVTTVFSAGTGLLTMQAIWSVGPMSPATLFLQILLPSYLLSIVVGVVLSAAAFRAVMRPAERRFGFLRVGMDELRVLGMGALWFLAFLLFYFLMMAFGIVLGGMLYADGNGVSTLGMIPALLLLLAPIYSLMIWLHVRLSPVLPLILLRRSFTIGEAWQSTKGEFWRLFAGYLVIVLIMVAAYIVANLVVAGPYWGALLRGASPIVAADAMYGIGPLTIIGWLVNGAVSTLGYAVWAGSVGTATQELIGLHDGVDYAETFG